ncbi:MAG: SpoIVB peptidase [Bacilli bacterium]|nr:SpoIVB peptidase [Bacilli bacterium]
MKFKKIFLMLLISLLSIPINVLAYSDKLILGGNNIGIEVKTKGILVIGLYEIDGKLIAESSGVQKGDYITKVNNNSINSISDYTNEINKDDDKTQIDIEYIRKGKSYQGSLKIVNQNGEYKTGLYVKDTINGIGTLTFIDPKTKKFGALGHEIADKNTNETLNIDEGSIYYSYITGITKSINGVPGEKEANYDANNKYGIINENTIKGIFGDYTSNINSDNLYEVAKNDEIKLGKANIFTVIEGEDVQSYEIEIEKINTKDTTKNIVFKITDEKLLNLSGGIVQGMSGSPIVQDDKIIGAVTHVIVNDCTRGYGIFITNMLEEAEN